jgi:hypothetical protein
MNNKNFSEITPLQLVSINGGDDGRFFEKVGYVIGKICVYLSKGAILERDYPYARL